MFNRQPRLPVHLLLGSEPSLKKDFMISESEEMSFIPLLITIWNIA